MRRALLTMTAACAALAGCGGTGPQASRHVPSVSQTRDLSAHKQAGAAAKHRSRKGGHPHKAQALATVSSAPTPPAAPAQPVTHSYEPPARANVPAPVKPAPTAKSAPEAKPAPEPKQAPTHTSPTAASPGGEGSGEEPTKESTKTTTTTGRPHNEPGFY